MRRLRPLAIALALLAAAPPAGAGALRSVSLELILGVDVSTSVNDREYSLQIDGIAAALRDPAVAEAIKAHPKGVAFALFQWAGVSQKEPSIPWRVLRDQADIDRLAADVAQVKIANLGHFTAIGKAIAKGVDEIETNAFEAPLRRIDISGDGHSNSGPDPRQIGLAAAARGVTVSGLAVQTDEARLGDYYRTHVAAGPGSFVEVTTDYEGFHRAMLRKLLRELEPALADAAPRQERHAQACSARPANGSQ